MLIMKYTRTRPEKLILAHFFTSQSAGLNITVQKWRDIVSDQKQKCQTHVCKCQSTDRRVSMKLPLPPKASTYILDSIALNI